MTTASTLVYDSSARRTPFLTEFRNIVEYRKLLRLLIVRDLTLRYKRSVLGVWWTLLNPLLFTAVLWLVFSNIFRFAGDDGIPFIVYLLSGILMLTFFAQGAQGAGGAIVSSSSILTKIYVPPECFALSAAAAAGVNFLINMVPLLVIQVVTGVGIPWTVVLTPIPILAMLAFTTGVGLLIASAAVYFYDILDLSSVFIQVLYYLTPAFYPVSIVPDHLRVFIEVNPVYSYLTVFRHFVYRGDMPPPQFLVYMTVSAVVTFTLGVWVFSRVWKRLVVLL